MKSWPKETPKDLQQMRREGSPGGRIIDYSRPKDMQAPDQGTYQIIDYSRPEKMQTPDQKTYQIIDYSRPENMQTPNQGTQTRSQTWDTFPSWYDQQRGHTDTFPQSTMNDFSQSSFDQYTDYQYPTHPTGLVERTVALHDLHHPRMLSSTDQDTVGSGSSMVDPYTTDQAMTPHASSSDKYDGMPPPALPTGYRIQNTQNRRLPTKDVKTTPEAKGMRHPSRSKSQEKIINTLKSLNSQLDKLEQGIDGLRHSLEDPASYSSDTGKFSYSESVPEADRTRFDAMIPTYINDYNTMAQKIRKVKTEIKRREREMVTSLEASNAATGMQVEKPQPKRRRTTEKDPETKRR